jgi:hypothetical protein
MEMGNCKGVNYEKRKNIDLFKTLEKEDTLFLSNLQNYSPIYKRFFLLNETNYKSVNFNNVSYITDVKGPIDYNTYECVTKNNKTNKTSQKEVFFKLAPLLDPFKYLIGKYNYSDPNLFALPNYNSETGDVHPKLLDHNNSSYIDGLFSFLSSILINEHNFLNGVNYYGSFLAVKNDFNFNVIDDIDYLCKSDFFNKNKNKTLFRIEDYDHLIEDGDERKPLIKISNNESIKSNLSIKSINDDLFEDLFESVISNSDNINDTSIISLDDIKEISIESINECDLKNKDLMSISTTVKSNSTCSSRTSHTSNNDDLIESENLSDDKSCNESESESDSGKLEDLDDSEGEFEDESEDEEVLMATIPKFPVQVICMEYCEDTLDNLIMNQELSHDEWFSALMQVIMILITYQKAFSFTHNDLHTNNIMYKSTDKKFIYYLYKKKYYKVPTFGRIFKMIDFGRSIYKYDGKTFCSDSFQTGGDAATQYNIEPYFNDKKPRLEPNYSFDLCRLGCSIFDYLVEEMDEIKDLDSCTPIVRVIIEWCTDDNGVNILYKNNGSERYPDFKLYKMIARCVHNHTPQAQLERTEFKSFLTKKIPENKSSLINIDEINSY